MVYSCNFTNVCSKITRKSQQRHDLPALFINIFSFSSVALISSANFLTEASEDKFNSLTITMSSPHSASSRTFGLTYEILCLIRSRFKFQWKELPLQDRTTHQVRSKETAKSVSQAGFYDHNIFGRNNFIISTLGKRFQHPPHTHTQKQFTSLRNNIYKMLPTPIINKRFSTMLEEFWQI